MLLAVRSWYCCLHLFIFRALNIFSDDSECRISSHSKPQFLAVRFMFPRAQNQNTRNLLACCIVYTITVSPNLSTYFFERPFFTLEQKLVPCAYKNGLNLVCFRTPLVSGSWSQQSDSQAKSVLIHVSLSFTPLVRLIAAGDSRYLYRNQYAAKKCCSRPDVDSCSCCSLIGKFLYDTALKKCNQDFRVLFLYSWSSMQETRWFYKIWFVL